MSRWFFRKSVGKPVKWKFAIRQAKNLQGSAHASPRGSSNVPSILGRGLDGAHFAQFKVQEPGPRWHRRYRFGPRRSRIRTVADFSGQARTRYQHSSVSVTSAIDAARCFISSILLIPSKLRFALSGRRDSNPRPLEPHSSALPSCATARFF